MATSGKRLIVINANLFPGSIETLKVGDHVDLLAFQGFRATAGSNRPRRRNAVDGTQPGQAPKPKNNRASSSQLIDPVSPASATLIAENAEVMSVTNAKKGANKRAGRGNFIVFQMSPQDAHVTSLMVASDVMLRAVFRPYGDTTRLTSDKPPAISTRLPKAVLDPELIQVIANGKTYVTKPNSKIFLSEEEAIKALQGADTPKMIYGKSVTSEDASGSADANETITKDEELVDPSDAGKGSKQPVKKQRSAQLTQEQVFVDDEVINEDGY